MLGATIISVLALVAGAWGLRSWISHERFMQRLPPRPDPPKGFERLAQANRIYNRMAWVGYVMSLTLGVGGLIAVTVVALSR